MTITSSPNLKRNSIPRDNDVADVISPFAIKCGLGISDIELVITGTHRHKQLNKPGIKIVSYDRYSVLVIICTRRTDSIEAHLYVKNAMNNGSRGGNYVFEDIVGRLKGEKVYLLPPIQSRKIQDGTPGKTVASDAGLVNIGEELLKAVSNKTSPRNETETDDEANTCDSDKAEDEVETDAQSTETQVLDTGHSYYFKDMRNVQRAVTELVTMAGEDVNHIFKFSHFIEVIGNVGAPATIKPVPTIRTFMSMGLIVRINENPAPARYNITEKALKFACFTDTELALEARILARRKSGQRKPKQVESETEEMEAQDTTGVHDEQPLLPETSDPLNQIALLKARAEGHRVTLVEIEEARAKLNALRGGQTDNEAELRAISLRIDEIDIEILRLQAERDELLQKFEELQRPSEEVTQLELTIKNLEKRAKDPSILAALKQLEDIRRMMIS